MELSCVCRRTAKREEIVPEETVVVSPDVGGVRRARRMAERLKTSLAILDKRRPSDNVAEVVNIIGEVKDKVVILFDDIIDTAHSIVKGAEALKKAGAKKIIACATHGVFSENALERIENSPIDTVYITDTIYHERLPEKVKVISVANLIGEAIMRIRKHLSVSILFR